MEHPRFLVLGQKGIIPGASRCTEPPALQAWVKPLPQASCRSQAAEDSLEFRTPDI